MYTYIYKLHIVVEKAAGNVEMGENMQVEKRMQKL